MLIIIKILKRYCKMCFLRKKKLDDNKKFYLNDKFFESNRNFTV